MGARHLSHAVRETGHTGLAMARAQLAASAPEDEYQVAPVRRLRPVPDREVELPHRADIDG